ncbi:MAG: tetratricopeptide repeat protein, partial [Candidatus Hydrogenedentes bacterium]|nr:tetratricopeptide repeat protein [Candidatus Hydrogenedentota bacterium]
DVKAWHDLAEQLLSLNETAEAEQAARRALQIEPLHLSAATTLCNILLNRGDVDEARGLLEDLEAAGIAPPHVVTALGAIACRQGRIQEACERLEAVLTAAPNTIMARLCYARALDLSGRAADARWQLEMAKLVCPSFVEIDNRLKAQDGRSRGEQAIREEEFQQALAMLVAALRDDPEDPLIHLDVGVCLEKLEQQDAAQRSFARAARLAASLEGRREMLT